MFWARPLLAMLLFAAGVVKLGGPAPDFRITDGKATKVELADFQGKKEIVLLFGGEIPDRAVLRTQLDLLGTALVHVNSENDPEGIVRRKFLGEERGMTAVLIDRRGRVRGVERVEAPGDVVTTVKKWQLGRANYAMICASCHGEDGVRGLDMWVPRLKGIGNRLTQEQIRSKIYAAPAGLDKFFVRGYLVTEQDLDAVVVYIAGL